MTDRRPVEYVDEDLRAAPLGGSALTGVRFDRSDLRGADLADLTVARLGGADLTQAVLRQAVLRDADRVATRLDGIALGEARLPGVILDLEGAARLAESLGATIA